MACRRNRLVGAEVSAVASPFLDYQPHVVLDYRRHCADSLSCVEHRIMYALLFVQFSLESFYDPARRALTTELVRRQTYVTVCCRARPLLSPRHTATSNSAHPFMTTSLHSLTRKQTALAAPDAVRDRFKVAAFPLNYNNEPPEFYLLHPIDFEDVSIYVVANPTDFYRKTFESYDGLLKGESIFRTQTLNLNPEQSQLRFRARSCPGAAGPTAPVGDA